MTDSYLCECGEVQNDDHLLECSLINKCEFESLYGKIDDKLMEFLEFWAEKGMYIGNIGPLCPPYQKCLSTLPKRKFSTISSILIIFRLDSLVF
jgi:hypothetical protein